MTGSQESIRPFLERSFEAYRCGEYMALFDKTYESYIHSTSLDKLVADILDRRKYRSSLEAAFESHSPRADEIFLYILEYDGVVTDQRLFLVDNHELACPPIELHDIESYQLGGILGIRQRIQLHDGSKISRKVQTAPESETMMKLIEVARDPSAKSKLAVTPRPPIDKKKVVAENSEEIQAALMHLDKICRQITRDEEIAEYGLAVVEPQSSSVAEAFNLWSSRALIGIAADVIFAGRDGQAALGIIGVTKQGNVYGGLVGVASGAVTPGQIVACELRRETIFKSQLSLVKAVRTDKGLTALAMQTGDGLEIQVDFPKCFVPDNERWPIRIRKYRNKNPTES